MLHFSPIQSTPPSPDAPPLTPTFTRPSEQVAFAYDEVRKAYFQELCARMFTDEVPPPHPATAPSVRIATDEALVVVGGYHLEEKINTDITFLF